MIAVELAIVSELRGYGVPCETVFDGITTRDERKAKLRVAIPKAPADKQDKLRQRFHAAYGEPLVP